MAVVDIVFEVSGEKEVIGSFNDRHEWIVNKLDEIIRESAHKIYLDAVGGIPVSSGKLISSLIEDIQATKYKTINAIVRTLARHGTFIEFGSGPYGAQTNTSDRPGWHHYKSQIGFPNVAKLATWARLHGIKGKVKHRNRSIGFLIARAIFKRGGLKARPFLYPAFSSEVDNFLVKVRSALAIEGTYSWPGGTKS